MIWEMTAPTPDRNLEPPEVVVGSADAEADAEVEGEADAGASLVGVDEADGVDGVDGAVFGARAVSHWSSPIGRSTMRISPMLPNQPSSILSSHAEVPSSHLYSSPAMPTGP